MNRRKTGRYETTSVAGERVRAFVPAPLPPDPALAWTGALPAAFEAAAVAVGQLDAVSVLLPDTSLFLYSYVRKEAVLSSQIEGTQSSLSDLLLFELDETPGVPLDDVVEVSNYVAALHHGMSRIRGGFPLSNRLIREIHDVLLSRGRGAGKAPGEFRRSQNWIGGTRPGDARFVPPPHTAVPDCMSDLERFMHARSDGLPVLVRAGVAHVQFETIHPFLDGNGRVGRLLISLLLCDQGLLREPLLYLSLYFKRHRARYYELLDRVRSTGDWESWLTFYLDGVRVTAEGAVAAAQELGRVFRDDRTRLETLGRRAGSVMRVQEVLTKRPIVTLREATRLTGLSFPSTSGAMNELVRLGIAREMTGRRRNRVYVYEQYLTVLNRDV